MVKDGDIFGDGVNIAARLENLAMPGGICISRGVRDHVRKMGRFAFEDLGEQSVKNIEQPIRAFRRAPVRRAVSRRERALGESRRLARTGPHRCTIAASRSWRRGLAELELAFWESIKDSQDAAEFAAYLEKYPDGTFAALAETRRSALLERPGSSDEEPEADAVELAYWDTMKDSDNPDMFRAYLERYPDGAFAPLAKVRLEELGAPST